MDRWRKKIDFSYNTNLLNLNSILYYILSSFLGLFHLILVLIDFAVVVLHMQALVLVCVHV